MRKLDQRFHQLRRLVLGLSAANEEVLALVPSERARFESLGWAILITSGVATVSMWFALASAVGINGILAFPIALAWGLVIMGIDRWLIVTMPVEGRRKFLIAVPRLALALLLGTLISTPLVLRVFQSEINAQIAKMQEQSYNTFLQQQQASDVAKQVGTYSSELQYLDNVIATHGTTTANTASDPELKGYNGQLTTLDSELAHWTTLKSQYYSDYICQLYGGPTCPKKGFGPAAKDSQQNYNAASQEVSTLEGQINRVQGEIQQRDAQLTSTSKSAQESRYTQALAQQPIVKDEYNTALQRQNELQASFFASNQAAHGILIRLEALSQLSNGNLTVTAARFLLFLLFLVIECLPVTVKLLQEPGLYDEALDQARAAERRDASKFFSFRSRLIGPTGTAVMWAMPNEPDRRLEAIWTPPRALSGSVVSDGPEGPEDGSPTEMEDGPWPSWGPGGRLNYGQTGRDRPERPWSGAKRWLNHWQGRPAEDDEPPPEETRRDAARMGDPVTDPGNAVTRRDQEPAGAAPRAGGDWPDQGWEGDRPDRGREEAYDSQGYRVLSFEDEDEDEDLPGQDAPDFPDRGSLDRGSPGRHSMDRGPADRGPADRGSPGRGARDDAWYDEETSGRPGDQAPAPAGSPGNGGTPLTWEGEDE
jgi:Domain of unknown function (DUF4407)